MRWKFLSPQKPKAEPRLPDGVRIYAVGDLHGRADLLEQTLADIDAHLAQNPVERPLLVFLGDYIDRGPGSREVISRLIELAQTRGAICLKGNHEVLLQEFLRNPAIFSDWRQYGGRETLMSYGLQPGLNPASDEQVELAQQLSAAMPQTHADFLRQLPSGFTCGDYFFVHAGVKPGLSLAQQRDEHLLWIREEFLLHEDDFEKIVVHGHTPVPVPDIRHNRINIDTGAYATGRLTCLVLEGDNVEVLSDLYA